jgi:hypothetical protein
MNRPLLLLTIALAAASVASPAQQIGPNPTLGEILIGDFFGDPNADTFETNGEIRIGELTTGRVRLINPSGVTLNNRGSLNIVDSLQGSFLNQGTVYNYGTISGAYSYTAFENDGLLVNQAGGTILGSLFNRSVVRNFGTISNRALLNFGTIESAGSFRTQNFENNGSYESSGDSAIDFLWSNGSTTNAAAGSMSIGTLSDRGGTLTNEGSLTIAHANFNAGVVRNSGNLQLFDTMFVYGSGRVENTGTILNTSFMWSALSGGTVINSGEFINERSLLVEADGRLTGTGSVSNRGVITMTGGTLSGSVSNQGAIKMAGGTLTASQLNNMIDGTLSFVLTGTTAGVGYFPIIAESMILDGTLEVVFGQNEAGAFTPQLGDTFVLLKASQMTGAFQMFKLASLPPTSWQQEVVALDAGGFGYQLTFVPLPAAAWLLLTGMGGLGALARRRAVAA